MHDEALKCRFLEGLALLETDELSAAVDRSSGDRSVEAEKIGNSRLLGTALREPDEHLRDDGERRGRHEASAKAIPVLRRLDDRVALAKVQWGLATLLRETGQIAASIGAYRRRSRSSRSIGMRADIAALNLVVADLLLEEGRDAGCSREIAAALPVISELKMAPEGMAALSSCGSPPAARKSTARPSGSSTATSRSSST